MQDNIEKRIINAFSNYHISLTSEKILNRVKKKKISFVKLISMISVSCFALSCVFFLLFINNGITNESLIKEKIRSKEYISEVVGFVSPLNNLSDSLNKKAIEKSNVSLLESIYDEIQEFAISFLNYDSFEYVIEENNYNYSYVIQDNIFNQNYVFECNLNNNGLKGKIYNSNYSSFKTEIECEFKVDGNQVYTTSKVKPFGSNNLCYKVKETSNGLEYKFNNKCTFLLARTEDEINISYEGYIIENISLGLKRTNDNKKYEVNYEIGGLNGTFEVYYTSFNKYSFVFPIND